MATRRLNLALALMGVTAAQAGGLPPPAYQLAAAQAGIPASVLFAIAQQESGTPLRGQLIPWPWTLNIAGTPQRFATRDQACTALTVALSQHDPKRIDVGLGQTNLGYHPERYPTACDALDPPSNLAVTADLLRQHYADVGDGSLPPAATTGLRVGLRRRATARSSACTGNALKPSSPAVEGHAHDRRSPGQAVQRARVVVGCRGTVCDNASCHGCRIDRVGRTARSTHTELGIAGAQRAPHAG
jgi:hypothetical protein